MCRSGFLLLIFIVVICIAYGVRINFTNCLHPDWTCLNNVPSDITYTCAVRNGVSIQLKAVTDKIYCFLTFSELKCVVLYIFSYCSRNLLYT